MDTGIYVNLFEVRWETKVADFMLAPRDNFPKLKSLRQKLVEEEIKARVYAVEDTVYGYGLDQHRLNELGFNRASVGIRDVPQLASRLIIDGYTDSLVEAGYSLQWSFGRATLYQFGYPLLTTEGGVMLFRGFELQSLYLLDPATEQLAFGLVIDAAFTYRDPTNKPIHPGEVTSRFGNETLKMLRTRQGDLALEGDQLGSFASKAGGINTTFRSSPALFHVAMRHFGRSWTGTTAGDIGCRGVVAMNLFGKILPEVQLRFNSASKFATSNSPRSGIRKFGPYDAGLFSKAQIDCGLIYPANLGAQRDALVNGLVNGDGSTFPGFYPWFRTRIKFDSAAERTVTGDERALKQVTNDLAAQGCDLVYIIVTQRNTAYYQTCKSILLSNGIPCQFVTAANLQNPAQRPWVLGNIALASYAKVGGTPWVVADAMGGRELIMGVSRAQDETRNYVVGFVTLFNQDGDFLLLHSKTPVVSWAEYVRGLEDLIVDAYQDYETSFGIPQSLVIHFHKRPGYQEIEAIDGALRHLKRDIPYAMVHLNEFSSFRLFDTAHTTHVPEAGLQVGLSSRRALLVLDGREVDKRNRMGIPNVWDISLDKRSTMSPDDFQRIVRQVHRFAKVNWRGFNARSVPVTINYSKLICDQVLEIGLKSWNSMISSGKLRDKAWFL